jgi:heme/copper-type cytochrome/quinol oxidase subunit 3
VTETQPLPRRASTIAMALFLAALAMLFIGGMLGYVLIRAMHPENVHGTVHLPRSLWISTMLMLISSYTIHMAMNAVRRERQELFRTYLAATILFASLFVVVQTPAMVKLYRDQTVKNAQREAAMKQAPPAVLPGPSASYEDEIIKVNRSVPFDALVMVLILIHALHVVGGLAGLGMVTYNATKSRYDHENYAGVRNTVWYWHFLDIIWIAMFTVISAFG